MKQHQWQHNEPSLQLGHTREGKPFTLTGQDFARHKHIMGISGSGKSYFLASIATLLFSQNIAFCLIDPHGDLAKLVLTLLAASDYFTDARAYDKLWYVDFKRAEKDAAVAFNVLHQPYEAHTVANNLLEAMHRAFPVSQTTTSLDNTMLAAALALIENQKPLTDLPRFILDAPYRDTLVKNVSDAMVVQFFKAKFGDKVNAQLVDSTLRRSFLLTFSPTLRNSLGQRENTLNFRSLMDNKISCIFNLGGLDDQTKRLLGCLIMVGLEQAFLSRADIEETYRHPYHVIVDEFQSFMSNSEVSFSRFLEECRKYRGVMYCAHQHLQQLPSGIEGALQNALTVVMRAGYADSSKLTSNFYRPVAEKPDGLLTSFLRLIGLLDEKPNNAFEGLQNKDEARYVFETLRRQEALVTLNGITTLIKTNTIPQVRVDPKRLKEIEDIYAQKLLTPLHTLNNTPADNPTTSTTGIAQRRVPGSAAIGKKPFHTFVGAAGSDDELLSMLAQYHYMNVSQVCAVLQKQSSINNIRTKLTKLVKEKGFVEPVAIAKKGAGKPPTIYTLSIQGMKYLNKEKGFTLPLPAGTRTHGYIEHTLEVNNLLINAALVPTVQTACIVTDILHERQIKNTPYKVSGGLLIPDGYTQFLLSPPLGKKNELVGMCFELDRNTEEKEKIQKKMLSYCSFASGVYQDIFETESLTIAFMVRENDKRMDQLLSWCEEVLQKKKQFAPLFLFASVPVDIAPHALFFDELFFAPFDPVPHALIEQLP